MPEDLVLLHGFSGTHRTWDPVRRLLDPQRYRALAPDLPGHGAAAEVRSDGRITFATCVGRVLEQAPARFVLCGYSFGGRVALHLALAAPERVSALVLVACNPGIEDARERRRRRDSDEALAARLEHEPLESFVESWRNQPLFALDPPEVARAARQDQRRNDPRALAAVLRGTGTGVMEPLWDRVGRLTMPTLFLAGERDRKFVQIGGRLVAMLPAASLRVVPGGHGLPLENPAAVAEAIAATGPGPAPRRRGPSEPSVGGRCAP